MLTPFTPGVLDRDSGKVSIDYREGRSLMRGGQEVTIYKATHTLKGKRDSVSVAAGLSMCHGP